MRSLISPLVVAATVGLATTASAATIAPSVTTWNAGAGVLSADPMRSSPANVNDGDSDFLALGLGGEAIFKVSGGFTGPITITEVTYNLVDRWLGPYIETANVYVGTSSSNYTLLGSITNADAVNGVSLFAESVYYWLKIVDTTPGSSPSFDGFDLASVTLTPAPVPLPAAAPLLVVALGGLGFAARRKAKKSA